MPFLQSSGAISINNIKTLFGGPTSPSLANYYRGGAYVPTTKTVSYTAREPASGQYSPANGGYFWQVTYDSKANRYSYFLAWAGSSVWQSSSSNGAITSYTLGSITYYKGTLYNGSNFGIYRTYPSSYQQAINTGIPSSGTISLNQFYGAEKP